MNQPLLGVICAIGAVQGMFLALLLVTLRGGNRRANRWLAAFVAAFALLSLSDSLMTTGAILLVPHLGYTVDWLVLALGPLLLRYVDTLIGRRPPRWWGLHLIPAALVFALLLPTMFSPASEKRTLLEHELLEPHSTDPILLFAAFAALGYLVTAIRRLSLYAGALSQGHSRLEARTLLWLRHLLAVMCALWIIWAFAIVSGSSWAQALDLLAFPVAVYAFGYFALRQPDLLLDPSVRAAVNSDEVGDEPLSMTIPPALRAQRSTPEAATDPSMQTTMSPPSSVAPLAAEDSSAGKKGSRYARSGLTEPQALLIEQNLDALMALEKPWLENDLTLTQLAARIAASPKHLSQVLNERLGKTFFDYVNQYRVNEVQRCLADPDYRGQPILDIALCAGFNSKASFNALFRRYTGMTPSEYRSRVARGESPQR